ncbi:MAG: TRAP transporter fused permease subunit [Rhodospirillum sp.]|nr:TRAP transporter fused permease subunit [Rhodospirillum sp.]
MAISKRVVDILFAVGVRRRPSGPLGWVVMAFAIMLGGWVIYAALFAIIDPLAHSVIFVCGMLALLFMVCGARPSSNTTMPHWVDFIGSALALAAGVYFFAHIDQIATRISLLDELSSRDLFFGSVVFILTVEATRRAAGVGLLAIVLLFIAYNLFGDHLGGVIGHGGITYVHFLDVMMFTTEGVFGVAVRVAATYAFLFVFFGVVLERAGGANFFFNISSLIAGRYTGGPAKIAVLSSGAYGMISGSPTADVVTTGTVTIPIMKRLGYSGREAGAIEVVASAGGGIVPPVMGSAAFIMAEFTGIAYRDIAIAALLPAILYYVGLFSQVHFRSVRLGMKGFPPDQIPSFLETMKGGGLFLIPLIVLVVCLFMGFSPTGVAVWGAISVIAVAALRTETRLGPWRALNALGDATILMVTITAACAAAGLVVGGISVTGLAPKFTHLLALVSAGEPMVALVAIAGLVLMLGMGMPTPNVYILTAVLVGPTLVHFGIDQLGGNLFLIFFAALSALTPPVAVAAFAAAPIAMANPLHIAISAVRFCAAGFVIPFLFVFTPSLLMEGNAGAILLNFATAAAGIILMAAAMEGYLLRPMSTLSRFLVGGGALLFVLPGVVPMFAGLVTAGVGFVLSSQVGDVVAKVGDGKSDGSG